MMDSRTHQMFVIGAIETYKEVKDVLEPLTRKEYNLGQDTYVLRVDRSELQKARDLNMHYARAIIEACRPVVSWAFDARDTKLILRAPWSAAAIQVPIEPYMRSFLEGILDGYRQRDQGRRTGGEGSFREGLGGN